MNFFDGLYPYEVIMLLLGMALFVALLAVLVILILRKQPYGKLILFFALSIIMIGFPGIKSFEIGPDGIGAVLADKIHALEQNPENKEARQELAQLTKKVSSRSISDPKLSAIIAEAQYTLGQKEAAQARLETVLDKAPQLPAALNLKTRIELDEKVADLTAQIERNPANSATRNQLTATLSEVTQKRIASPESLANIARAQKVLGNEAEASNFASQLRRINQEKIPAIQLEGHIESRPTPIRERND